MMRVKICGMTSEDDVEICVDAGADALGFIFAESPRRLAISDGSAFRLSGAVPPFVTTVGVFANDPAELVRAAVEACRLDVLQFSGDESPAYCGSFGKPTIVALRGRTMSRTDLEQARAIALLVDGWHPQQFGGTGTLVDEERFARIRAGHTGIPIVLAGGLSPSNVRDVVKRTRPDAVDARTGVERDGRKDPELVRAFVAAARCGL
jgi:phosphoribosylanthranilate isomerase